MGSGWDGLPPSGFRVALEDGRRIGVPEQGLLVGRSRACDLVVADEDASRRHLLLRVLGDALWVVDEGSTNGTLVDGEAVSRKRVAIGQEIVAGTTRMVVEEGEGDWPEELVSSWSRFEDAFRRRSMDAVEALRVLAAAEDCRAGSDGAVAINWAEGERGLDGLGPMRMKLVHRALGMLAGADPA